MKKSKPWSTRFAKPLNEKLAQFNASVHFDKRLAEFDAAASIAHAQMLGARGIIPAKDAANIQRGLKDILKEIRNGKFPWKTEYEDVHFNIERRLIEKIGGAGKRLHTARSRNDQTAAALRLFLRAQTDQILDLIADARLALLQLAEKHANTLAAGMTHMQTAQPVVFGHHLLAYDDMLQRDAGRFADCRKRLNLSPLGAGALAGVGYPVDRRRVAKTLGFDGLCQNSIDAVSDRDFAVEFAAAAALMTAHLSRFCEEIIVWCSQPFGCVSLDDSFCTGSSIMPQKKNPDAAELVRAKTGRTAGALTSLLMMIKGQPLAYNKDNQEDKEAVFDSADTAQNCLVIFAGMVRAMRVNTARMRELLDSGYPTATELADYLTAKGAAFKDAHAAVGALVRALSDSGKRLEDITLEELRRYAPQADKGALLALRPENAVRIRNHTGGTAPKEVRRQIARRKAALKKR